MENFWHSFSWLDFIILGIVLASVIVSFFRGFIREAIALISWLVGLMLGIKYATVLADRLPDFVMNSMLRYGLAFTLIVVAVVVTGAFINFILKLTLHKVGFGFLDRFLGLLFGFARGVLVVAVITMFLNVSSLSQQRWYGESALLPHFVPMATWLERYLPLTIQHITAWINEDSTQTLFISSKR